MYELLPQGHEKRASSFIVVTAVATAGTAMKCAGRYGGGSLRLLETAPYIYG